MLRALVAATTLTTAAFALPAHAAGPPAGAVCRVLAVNDGTTTTNAQSNRIRGLSAPDAAICSWLAVMATAQSAGMNGRPRMATRAAQQTA